MDRKKLPIGISDYKLLISEDYYYVNKTDFIRQIVEDGSLITLLPRPHRFGKTLNLSTLRYFFKKTEGNVYRPLFKGKSIEQWKDFDKYQGKYPVILITLKDCSISRWTTFSILPSNRSRTNNMPPPSMPPVSSTSSKWPSPSTANGSGLRRLTSDADTEKKGALI